MTPLRQILYERDHGAGSWDRDKDELARKAAAGIVKCGGCKGDSPAGTAQDYRTRWTCPGCRAEQERGARLQQLRAALSTLPTRYASDKGLRFGPSEDVVLRESATGKRNIVITGPSGAGKTSLAVAYVLRIIRRAEEDGYAMSVARGVMFTDSFSLERARAGHKLGAGEAPLVRAAMEATTLVLDELGSEGRGTDKTIIEVIHARHKACLRTIFTTASPAADISAKYGDGIARRIWQDALRCDLQPRLTR